MSLPRAELLAAYLNATTGYVVKLALGNLHKECVKLTDIQVALHWVSSTKDPLEQWVRYRVVEINRLADRSMWKYKVQGSAQVLLTSHVPLLGDAVLSGCEDPK